MEHPALIREAQLQAAGKHAEMLENRDDADSDFEQILRESISESIREKSFYTKIAGTSHRNSDGSSRCRILARCGPFDTLELRPEPENEFDSNAIAVCRPDTGEQLGYLNARLAAEITADRRRYPERWIAAFRHRDYDPEFGHVVGGVIYIICLTADYVRQGEEKLKNSPI